MGIIKSLCRCLICRSGGNLEYVRQIGIYSAGWYGYHQKCLDLVCEDPESYSHIQVDAALEIINLRKSWAKEDENRKKKLAENCKYLKEVCV